MSNRVAFDFYETPPWQTQALLRRVQIAGRVLECCAGDWSLANQLKGCDVYTNDVDPMRAADFHMDASQAPNWQNFPVVDWVVTNPPFNKAFPILKNALKHARFGVVMLLRISFLEPTEERTEFLSDAPPQQQIVLPRWSYKQNGATDSVTTAWYVWRKAHRAVEIVGRAEKEELLALK